MTRVVAVRSLTVLAVWLCSATASAQAPACTISVTSVVFGTYDVFSATPTDSTGTITFNCNNKAKNITVALSQGTSGTYSSRTMIKAGEALAYNLFQNAARTSIWGDGTGGTSVYSNANPPNSIDVTLTIFGRIPAVQDVSAGNYSDTVSATINF